MNDNAEYVFDEINLNNKIKYTKSLPLEDIIALANNIWSEVKKLPDDISEKQYYELHNKYNEFGSSFPIILRWMIQLKKYSTKAFKRFLIKYSNTDITSRRDFLILQAEYLVYLFEENKHHDKKVINNYREFIIKQLLEEDEKMNNIIQEAEEEIRKREFNKRNQLYNYVKQLQK